MIFLWCEGGTPSFLLHHLCGSIAPTNVFHSTRTLAHLCAHSFQSCALCLRRARTDIMRLMLCHLELSNSANAGIQIPRARPDCISSAARALDAFRGGLLTDLLHEVPD